VICNRTRGTTLAASHRLADSHAWRLRGMIGRRFDAFQALVFERCNNIHTWFMGIPLDVLFVDAHYRVVAIRRNLRPWRMAMAWRARHVIELPAGAAANTEEGDRLELLPD